MSPRYCRQLSSSDCGPIGILNALKWAGLKVSLRKYMPYLNGYCRPEGYGTPLSRLNSLIIKLKKDRFQARYRKRATLRELEQHIRDDGAILLYYYNGKDYHFALVTSVKGNGTHFVMVNAIRGQTMSEISRPTLKKYLRNGEPAMWLLSRIQKR